MGRYSSVQAYADSNNNMRSVSYQQATGSTEAKTGPVKAEKVSNPYGSTAGAGSGEFHVYRHARSREMERWAKMEQQDKLEQLNQEFSSKLEDDNQELASKTDKNRKKRLRQKEAKQRKLNLQRSGVKAAIAAADAAVAPLRDTILKRPPMAAAAAVKNSNVNIIPGEEEEFTYQPAETASNKNSVEEDGKMPAIIPNTTENEEDAKMPAIPNDGSFLKKFSSTTGSSQADDAPATASKNDDDDDDGDDKEEPPKKRQAK